MDLRMGSGNAFVSLLLSALAQQGLCGDEAEFMLHADNADTLRECAGAFVAKLRETDWMALTPAPLVTIRKTLGGLVCFAIRSNGWTGKQWVMWFQMNRVQLSNDARGILLSPNFQTAPKGTVQEIVLMRDYEISTIGEVRERAAARCLTTPSPEVVCLICQVLGVQMLVDMDIERIVGLHQIIPGTDVTLLAVSPKNGRLRMNGHLGAHGYALPNRTGYALVAAPNMPNREQLFSIV